jgi:hypothetical protein
MTGADFVYAPATGIWTRAGAPTPAGCIVTYTPATALLPAATAVTTTGC